MPKKRFEMKKAYEAPRLAVIAFKSEQGFAFSDPQNEVFTMTAGESEEYNTATTYTGQNFEW